MPNPMRSALLTLAWLALMIPVRFAAEDSKTAPDYSKEAYVIRELGTKFAFEDDGTELRESHAVIQVLSDAGVQHWGVLSFSYQNFNQTLEIDYVRVKKADGTIVSSPPENVQDLTSEISRVAPLYTDQREKHVAVKALSPGDVLEYSVRTRVTKPLITGQFWMQYDFEHDEIVQRETLEVSIPASHPVKLKNRGPKYELSTDGNRRIYRWSTSNPTRKKDDDEDDGKVWKQARGRQDPPDVLLTSFASWDELGRWYDGLQQERVKPTNEIREKAAQLVKNAPDDDAKLRAIYNYVSTKFRYIGIDLGMGRYQPHLAGDVMDNGYGDCKDKHTLLASLLTAAGFKAYPALISTQFEVAEDVPSPGQFNHVITVVELNTQQIWLDTTPEVSPFGFLLGPLRGKHALVIPGDAPAVLAMTPLNPALKSSQVFEMKASLDENGTLTGDAERTTIGDDLEVLLRSGFRSVPMPQWKELAQRLSYSSGFGGEVSDVSASSPEDLSKPFRFSYKYTRKTYGDWDNRRISPPLPVMFLPDIGETKKTPSTPIWLGVPGEVTFRSSLVLPKGLTVQVPRDIDIKEDFAEYHAKYTLNGNTLTTERRLIFSVFEVVPATYEKYKSFRKVVNDDRDMMMSLISASGSETSPALNSGVPTPPQNSMNEMGRIIWTLPTSSDSVADQYEQDARTAMMRNDVPSAISSLQSAVAKDPKFTRAWLLLGTLLAATHQQGAAIDAYRNATNAAPDQVICYKMLGWTLLSFRKFEDAIPVWQTVIKLAPDDKDGSTSLGAAFMQLKRYSEAAPIFASAANGSPKSANLQMSLAQAYMGMGDVEKARAAFQQAINLDSSPVMLNNVAYALAEKSLDLDNARNYAEKAVRSEEDLAAKLDLATIKPSDVGYAQTLATFWDTLGWVDFRLNNLADAEKYLNAAWQISQSPVSGQHLGRVYEKQGKKSAAIRVYQLAVAASPLRISISGQQPSSTDNTSGSLEADLRRFGVNADPNNAITELNGMRTVKLPRIVNGSASAEFYILLGPGRKVEAKWDSGRDSLKLAEKTLASSNFKFTFPDDGPERIARKAIIGCYPSTGCSVVFMPYNTTFRSPAP